MVQNTLKILITVLFILSHSAPVMGAEAIVLTDHELDMIHAGNLNFTSPESFLGSVADVTAPKSTISPDKPAGVRTINNNGKVQIISPSTPTAPSQVSGPVTPASVTPAALPSQPAPAVPPSTGTQLPDVPATTSVPTGHSSPNVPNTLSTGAPSGGVPSTASAPVSSSINSAQTASPAQTALPATPAVPAQIATPATPQTPQQPQIVLDVLATRGAGGKTNMAIAPNNPNATITPFSTATNGSVNSVAVSETAQQNLSALVNVNAAGSVVPVQLNLTVIVNSTVGQVNSSNSLNLNNYSNFSFN